MYLWSPPKRRSQLLDFGHVVEDSLSGKQTLQLVFRPIPGSDMTLTPKAQEGSFWKQIWLAKNSLPKVIRPFARESRHRRNP